ncbi:unnamed protein product [Euphydryas editha]|uniref:Aldehyde dehydrogenase domain-containing protein n=1 Tax=Euphydryas editha TaxID=104508 RepID=A0AAU9TWS8_EUPED|nr:unnamed protein product [Euphydryas editha]
MSSSDLKFDEKIVDVKMAKEYLKVNTEFHSSCCDDNGIVEYDACNNKIFMSSCETLQCKRSNLSERDISIKFMNLAESISENIDLFCQLEYLIKKIPTEETRNVEIKLLIQHLIYQSSLEERDETCISEIYMYDGIPLSILGCIALSKSPLVTIFATKESAVICSLFVDLCRKVGLQEIVYLVFIPNTYIASMSSAKKTYFVEEFRNGCVGIVTEKGDMDSAIDTFLYATCRSPWNIKRIFVQECVLHQFMRRMEWKTKEPSSDVDERMIRSCTSVRVYEDKVYLFEYAGNVKNISENSIVIEAYRTNKELISLISAIKTLGVSLWSSDISESNEIAFNIKANIIWVNDFGCFDGPPVASQAYYSPIINYHKKPVVLNHGTEEILKKRSTWKKLDETDRHLKVWKVTKDILSGLEDSKMDIITKCYNNSTTRVGNKICTVIRNPVDVLSVKIKTFTDCLKHLNFIVHGGAVLFVIDGLAFATQTTLRVISPLDVIIKFCQDLEISGAPVALVKSVGIMENVPHQVQYNTKVVWSSIGTIFAN